MKAITYTEFGGPEVLRVAEVDEPHAGPGQVRLKVVAAGVNPLDSKIRNGWRPRITPPFPVVPGVEAAGVVDEVGEGVTGVALGDEVLGWTVTGAYAEHALAVDFGPKPADLDWDLAAALPVAVETSVRVLDALGVGEGDTLLLHGAAGVSGAAGVQLAVARGATVVGTASLGNHDYLRSLGAIPVAYGAGLADRVREAAPQGIDAVYDAAGRATWRSRSTCAAAPTGSSPSPIGRPPNTASPSPAPAACSAPTSVSTPASRPTAGSRCASRRASRWRTPRRRRS